MNFKPMLAPNQTVDLNIIKYPVLASYKLDGIRCIFKNGEILSRSLKQIQNKQLREKLEPLRKYSEDNNVILDGEFYSPDLTFQQITSFVMTQDLTDKKSIKKNGCILEIPESLKFYCFDCITNNDPDEQFQTRNIGAFASCTNFLEAIHVNHKIFNSAKEVYDYFEEALTNGYEGLILRDPEGRYKYGRGTLKEGLIYKLKPFKSTEGKIKGIVQSTIVDPNVEKKINELNRSVTSKKKSDRILINKASAFIVDYNGKDLKVTLSMSDIEKEHVWNNQEQYIGKEVEYKYLEIGMKEDGLPRHPTSLRMRNDKN